MGPNALDVKVLLQVAAPEKTGFGEEGVKEGCSYGWVQYFVNPRALQGVQRGQEGQRERGWGWSVVGEATGAAKKEPQDPAPWKTC